MVFKMKGVFKIQLARLLGYQTEEEKFRTKSPKGGSIQSLQPYLEMEIRIRPKVPKLSPNMEELPYGDLPYIEDYIFEWNANINNSFPSRKFSALAITTNAKTTCITRYIKALEPPQINLEGFNVTPEQCLRYISLIPFTECNHFYNNVWQTPNQLIHHMIGSVTDHCIALTCYLLALKKEVWLLLGYGIPLGSTAYVFIKEDIPETNLSNYFIMDVVYAEKYNLTDIHCPLRKIYCLVNGENIWANTQSTDNIGITRFDLNRKSDWLPLFTKNLPAPNNSICNSITYTNLNQSSTLEMQLERHIKRQISKLRQLDRTVWNGQLSDMFKKVLKAFEMNCMYNKNDQETITDLHNSVSSYRINGFVINTPYHSLSSIVKRIKTLGIHIQEENNIEFVLAVHINHFLGNLLSVWIIIANLEKTE